MIVFVENRRIVVDSYKTRFSESGEALEQFVADDLVQWLKSSSQNDLRAIEAILIGETESADELIGVVRRSLNVPVIALLDFRSLEQTMKYYRAGVDDVVAKPVHYQELLIRIATIKKRTMRREDEIGVSPIEIFFDGRDPRISGEPVELPRRERRILEYLASINGRRASKSQIFGAIYGVFDDKIDESVVESHISKLRKKLRKYLSNDPIDSKRYLGYRLDPEVVRIEKSDTAERLVA
ncbi:MAG: response regulator transcription factor [Pseudomonadota bacterium]